MGCNWRKTQILCLHVTYEYSASLFVGVLFKHTIHSSKYAAKINNWSFVWIYLSFNCKLVLISFNFVILAWMALHINKFMRFAKTSGKDVNLNRKHIWKWSNQWLYSFVGGISLVVGLSSIPNQKMKLIENSLIYSNNLPTFLNISHNDSKSLESDQTEMKRQYDNNRCIKDLQWLQQNIDNTQNGWPFERKS